MVQRSYLLQTDILLHFSGTGEFPFIEEGTGKFPYIEEGTGNFPYMEPKSVRAWSKEAHLFPVPALFQYILIALEITHT